MRWIGPGASPYARAPGRPSGGSFTTDSRSCGSRLSRSRFLGGLTSLLLVAGGSSAVYVVAAAVGAPPASAAEGNCTPSPGYTGCQRLSYTGSDQSFTVPSGVTQLAVTSWGAGGGGADGAYGQIGSGGGGGASSTATLSVTPGQVLGVVVGQGGRTGTAGSLTPTYGGGGTGGDETGNASGNTIADGSSGGGLSGVFSSTTQSPATALVVAAGGGGSSPGASAANTYATGGGDATTANSNSSSATSGRGGGSTRGGAGATSYANCSEPLPSAGTRFQGGNGSGVDTATGAPLGAYEGGGGGGGGWFGGGGGKCQGTPNSLATGSLANGTGAGGSSYVGGAGVTAASVTAGGNGTVAGTAGTAADTADPQYESGVGAGGTATVDGGGIGGNGLVVFQWARTFSITQTATPTSVLPGDTVTYSLALTNTGPNAFPADYPASFSDNLTGVLDDAVYNGDATSNVAGWTFTASNSLVGSGPLAVGQTATVTYSVTVKNPDTGDSSLGNSVSTTDSGGSCTVNGCSVTTTVNPPLTCAPGTLYATTPGQLLSVNDATGAATVVTPWPSTIKQANALAVTAGGASAYVIDQSGGGSAGSQPSISRYSAATKSVTTFTGSPYVNTMVKGPVRGGINLSNGIYYYGATRASNNVDDFYAFDTRTNTPIGYVGSLSGFTGANGDLTFDSAGNMLLVVSNGDSSNNRLIRVSNMPTTASTAALTGTTLTTLPPNVTENGISFDGDGYLYASTVSLLYKLNPNTGALISSVAFSGNTGSVVDLADCEVNGSLALQNNIVARANPSDQFTLTVTGGGVNSGNTGATSGSTTGPQTAPTATAGPVIGILGTTYTLTETAASGSLSDYATSISCVDEANGNAPVTATPVAGSTTSYTLVFPSPATAGNPLANVVCTLTNTAFPRLTFTKTLGGNRVNAGDQFTLAVRTGSATGPVVATTTTTGTGSAVVAGTAGPYVAAIGTTYYLTEAAAGTTALSDYTNRSITCADANGNQSGLPDGAAFTGSVAISPVAGANITCTLQNTPNSGRLTLTKSASPTTVTATGQTVTYSFLVTNTGNVPIGGLAVTDAFTAPSTGSAPVVTCPASSLAVGASTTCTATYRSTQSDIDNGAINNSAFATGTDPSGRTVTSPVSTATVSATRTATLSIRPAVSPTTVTAVGQVVTYSFLVTNTGDSPVADLSVADSFTAPAGPDLAVDCPLSALAPSATTTCTATYSVSIADMDNAAIVNTALAEGTDSNNNPVRSLPSTVTVTATRAPALTVAESASPTTVARAGNVVTYSFLVTNTGNVTLSRISVTDALSAPAGPAPAVSCPATTLAPGARTTCSATYSVTQADVDNGVVVNTATATGTPPTGPAITSAPSTATVTANPAAALTVLTTSTPGSLTSAGQTVTYSFLVTNNGETTISNLAVADTVTAPAAPAPAVTCPTTTLAPLASTTCTGSYTATQADLDHGSIVITATANGIDARNNPVVSPPSVDTVTVVADIVLTLVKSASPSTVGRAGDKINYTFLLTNTGNVSLGRLSILDTFTAPAGPPLSFVCPTIILGPGGSTVCSGTYSVSQADIDNGTIVNSAVALAWPLSGAVARSNVSAAAVGVVPAPALSVVKSANPTSVSAPGQRVTYSFVVTNTGNETLTGITVNDTLTGPAGPAPVVSCPATTLAPRAQVTCTADYTVTAADMDTGSIQNTATATGLDPGGHPIGSTPSSISVRAVARPTLTVLTSAAPNNVVAVGDRIDYSFLVRNTGNVTLTGVGVIDNFATPAGPVPSVTCPATTLAAGAQTVCVAAYTASQADIDNATIVTTAIARATPPRGPVTTSAPSAATVNSDPTPALSLTTAAGPPAVTGAGDTVSYSFLVTNSGTATVTGLSIEATFTAPAAPALSVFCPVTTLAPSASTTCNATYAATQADIDAGTIQNSATADGIDLRGDPVASAPSPTTVGATPNPGLTVVTTANPATVTAAGDTVDYSFDVTNTGNVTLTDIAVADTLSAPAGPAVTLTCPVTTLAPGLDTICRASYTATQADIDNGAIADSATASGLAQGGPVTSAPSTATVTVATAPDLTIVQSVTPTTVNAVGDAVRYSYLVTNRGNVSLTGITVTDTFAAPAGPALDPACPSSTLAAGASTICTADYSATAADVDNGRISNTAVVTGTPPTGPDVTSAASTALVTIPAAPALAIAQRVAPATVTGIGDQTAYSFDVTNTGNVTLSDVSVADALAAPAGPSPPVTCPLTSLPAGNSMTCIASYRSTAADFDHGRIDSSATATGTPPRGGPVSSPPSTATVIATQAPALTLVASADPSTVTDIGDAVAYSFLVTNAGNVTLTAVSVADSLAAPAGPPLSVSCPQTTLAAGSGTVCTATYLATSADFDAGTVVDSATASAHPPSGPSLTSAASTATVTTTRTAALTIDSRADRSSVSAIGDTIAYSFVVTNTGNVTLTALTVNNTLPGPAPAVVCPTSTLTAGAATTCTAGYTATAADLDAGQIVEVATATGLSPAGGRLTSPSDTVAVAVAQAPGLALATSAAPSSIGVAGDQIQYRFLVTNTGNVSLSGVTVTGSLAGPQPDCPITQLAVGASMTCAATYTSTPADFDAGIVSSSAFASGTPPQGPPITSPSARVIVQAAHLPALLLVTSAAVVDRNQDGRIGVGDAIQWTFDLVNIGNVSLTTISVSDPKAGTVSCGATVLAPDGSTQCTAAGYTITQADVDAGSVTNTATGSGRPTCAPGAAGTPACAAVLSNESSTATGLGSSSAVQSQLVTARVTPGGALAFTSYGGGTGTSRGDGPALAFTGAAHVTQLAGLAAGLIALGLLLVAFGARRRRT